MNIYERHTPGAMTTAILFISLFFLFYPRSSLAAFSCTSNGVTIIGPGTFTIPVDVTISKSDVDVLLTDLSQYTRCVGDVNPYYRDALRTTNATISRDLLNAGFTGYVDLAGDKFSVPPGTHCIWPDRRCTVSSGNGASPLRVKIGITKTGTNTKSFTIPAGTEIARLNVEQRSVNSWGEPKTWVFRLKNALVMPSYTCQVKNSTQNVTMPSVRNVDLIDHGVGIYPGVKKFNINLDCDPSVSISIKFEGDTMSGTSDVLKNTSGGNDSVGIQISQKGTPVKLGTSLKVIDNAAATESLEFEGNYYYNGGSISAGPVTSVATFTMEYN